MKDVVSVGDVGVQYKNLVDEALWERVVGRIMREQGISRNEAEEIFEGALGFLYLCACYPGRRFAPSQRIDIGWHTFLLYTKEYQEFCERVAGRFIHHVPNDGEKTEEENKETPGIKHTVDFMREHGVAFNPSLWATMDGSDCTVDCRDDCWNCVSDK